MSRYLNPGARYGAEQAALDEGLRSHMATVYRHLCLGVCLSGLVAWAFSTDALSSLIYARGEDGLEFSALGFAAVLAPLAMLVAAMFGGAHRWSAAATWLFYVAFTAILGVSLSAVAMVHSGADIVRAFFATVAAFAGLSIWGYTTKRDLGPIGAACTFGLIGLIALGIIGTLTGARLPDMAYSALGIVVFSGLIAFDTQEAKNRYLADPADGARLAVWSALSLFLDAVNLFLKILQISKSDD